MTYPGGKNGSGVYHAIINEMPPHRTYIEPFLGSGAILRNKRPAAVTYACEVDPETFTMWEDRKWLLDGHSPLARDRDNRLGCDLLADPHRELLIYNTDFLSWASNRGLHRAESFGKDVLIYVDAPYLLESRSSKARNYKQEFHTWFEHEELLKLLLSLSCNVAVSHYDHPVYNKRLAQWRRIEFTGTTRGGPRTEVLWMNYAEPAQLHDYRYLGRDYREREAIRKQQDRWMHKLQAMPRLQQLALIRRLEESLASSPTAENGGAIARPIGIPSEEGRADAWFNCQGKGGRCSTHTSNASSLCDDCLRDFRAASGLLRSSPARSNGAAAGWLGRFARKVRSGDGRKPLKAELAIETLVDHYWLEDDIELALTSSDPLEQLVKTPPGNPSTTAADNFIDRQENAWTWSTEGDKISIWQVKKSMASGVPFGTTVEQLARKVLNYHVAGMEDEFRAEIGITWPQTDAKDLTARSDGAGSRKDTIASGSTIKARELKRGDFCVYGGSIYQSRKPTHHVFITWRGSDSGPLIGLDTTVRRLPTPTAKWHEEMIAAHRGTVNDSGVFVDDQVETVWLLKGRNASLRIELAYSEVLDLWMWAYTAKDGTFGSSFAPSLPNQHKFYDCAAPTREDALRKANHILEHNRHEDVQRLWRRAQEKPRKKKTPANTAAVVGA